MKLFIENQFDPSDMSYDVITENTITGEQVKNLYIHGPMLMAEGINGNGRIYPQGVLHEAVNTYQGTKIVNNQSVGELNHPPSPIVDLERSCHIITELKAENDNPNIFVGKSKVLTTPQGVIVRSLINDGVKLGMSSRALGNVEKKSDHNLVLEMKLAAIDVVHDPSFSSATMEAILENKDWICNFDNTFVENFENLETNIATIPNHKAKEYIMNEALSFIELLRS